MPVVLLMITNFNPRSREGSDEAAELRREEDAISIHAPVKGATACQARLPPCWAISIHAPVKGATTIIFFQSHIAKNFNPRSREGSDTCSE